MPESLPGATTALREELAREKARADAAEARAEKALAQRLVFDEALLREKAQADAQMAAVIHTIGGEVEGHPTTAINYLQRLRALVDIEKAFVDAGPMVRSAKYMVEKARDCERAEEALAAARRECEGLTDIVRCALYEEGYCERTRQNELAAAPQGHAPGCYASENAGCGCWVGRARYLAPDWMSADHAPECPSRRFFPSTCAAPADGEEGKR